MQKESFKWIKTIFKDLEICDDELANWLEILNQDLWEQQFKNVIGNFP